MKPVCGAAGGRAAGDQAADGRKTEVRMGNYTTILWDLDQTLLDFDRSMDYAIREVFARYDLYMDEKIAARYEVINRDHWNLSLIHI